MTDQIEFSSFFKLLNSIKEGDSEKISLLDEQINELKNGNNSKSFLEELNAKNIYFNGNIKLINEIDEKKIENPNQEILLKNRLTKYLLQKKNQ